MNIISQALLELFLAAMRFYCLHREVKMPFVLITTLSAMHRLAYRAHDEEERDAMLLLGVSIIGHSIAGTDPQVRAVLGRAQEVIDECGI